MPKHVMYLNKQPKPITLNLSMDAYEATNQGTLKQTLTKCIIEMYPKIADIRIDNIQESPFGTMIYHVSTTDYIDSEGTWTETPPRKQKIYIVQDFEMDRIKVFLNKKQAQQFAKTCIEQLPVPVLEVEDGGEFNPIHEM